MNGNQNNIPAPAPLPGEPLLPNQGGPEAQSQPQSLRPEPTPPSTPPSAPSPQAPPPPPSVRASGPGPAIPSSPKPDIGIRTMASDLSSLKASGGFGSKPETFKPEDFNKDMAINIKQAEAAGDKGLPADKQGGKPVQPKQHSQVLFISLGIVAFIVVAGLVIYFFVMPLIFPSQEAPITETSPVGVPPSEIPPVIQPLIHQSYFITTPASTTTMNLNNLNLAEVDSALNAAASGVEPQTVREVTLTVAGTAPETADFLAAAFPELDKETLASNFEKDFTVYLYRDANGSWPGYVFRLNPNSTVSQTTPIISNIESSTNIPNIYLTDLGAPSSAEFKDGLKIGETSARYLSFNTPGASFNYGWYNNNLVISTSFNGFREALKLLGWQ